MSPERQPSDFGVRVYRPILEDAVAASALLRSSVGASSWPEKDLLPPAFEPAATFAFFSELGGRTTGFIVGRHAAGEGEILNLAVSTSSRRQGQGRALVEQLLLAFREHSVASVFLEVRESNGAAIAFYEALGFAQVGRRPSYYRDPIEAALLYRKLLDSTG